MTMFKTNLLASTIGLMTAAERSKGRYMRAPDGHDGGDGGAGGGGGGSGASSSSGGGGGSSIDIANLPDTLDDINAVPAKLQGLYVKEGDKYIYKDPVALRSALDNVRSERNSLRTRAAGLSELENLGLSIDDVKALKADRDKAEQDRLKKEGDFETLRGQMEENHNKTIKKHEEREKKLYMQLERTMVDADARAVLADAELQGNPTLLLPHIRGRVKIVETDEGFERQVLLPDGKTPMLNAENKPATLRDLFLELKAKPEFQGAFKGVNQSGGGSPPNGGGGGAPPAGTKRSEMTALQRVQFIEKNGQDAYLKLPA